MTVMTNRQSVKSEEASQMSHVIYSHTRLMTDIKGGAFKGLSNVHQ